ncbi:hypothetical protein HK405_014668, partial [Cladochytrium tenue]
MLREDRLLILPDEEKAAGGSIAAGRPIGREYYDQPAAKHAFMQTHGLRVSVFSMANPWLDFVTSPRAAAADLARSLNDDTEELCRTANDVARSRGDNRRLYAFGVLPTGSSAEDSANEIRRIASGALPSVRGVIIGTRALGTGLDDPAVEPLLEALGETGL